MLAFSASHYAMLYQKVLLYLLFLIRSSLAWEVSSLVGINLNRVGIKSLVI